MKIAKFLIHQVVSTFLFSTSTLYAAVPDAVRGVKITPETLMQLAPRIPRHVRTVLDDWLANPQTQEMLNTLTAIDINESPERAGERKNALLKELGYANLSRYSYAVQIPGTIYMFKLPGERERLISMLATKGVLVPANAVDDAMLAGFIKNYLHEAMPTYHTASRMAYYLLFKDCCHCKFRHLYVPESYLMYIPGRPRTVEDENIIFVQKVLPDTEKLVTRPERITSLNKGITAELYEAVVALGLWDIQNNILIHKNGSVCLTCDVNLVGLRQSKNSSAKDFFHKSKERFDENVYLGLESLLDLFKDDTAKERYIKDRIKSDSRLKDSAYYEKLVR